MAKEKIGLEAVLEMASFNKAVGDYNRAIGGMESKTAGAASRINSTFASIGSGVLKVGKIIAGISLGAVAGLGAGLAAAGVAGLKFNNTMEQASARINAFTKDADLTAQILEDVRKEAALTPFEFDAMASAVSGLLPAAKQADVAIMDLLKDAEILAASNPAEGLEGAAFALREAVSGDFTSVIERFNLPRSMINQLKEEGVPALEIVRTAMKNMGYDMDLVSALANTAEGRWSTLKDTFTNLAGTVTKPIFDALSSGLGATNDWLTLIGPQLQSFAEMLAGQVAAAISAVSVSINKIVTAFSRFGVRGAAVSILGQLGLDPTQIASVMSVVDQVTGAIDKIQGAFDRFGLKGATVSIMGMLGLDPVTIGTIFTTIDQVTAAITGFVDNVMLAFSRFGAEGAAMSIAAQLGLSSDQIVMIIAAGTAVQEAIMGIANSVITNWPLMQAAALTAWEVIKGIIAGFQTVLAPVFAQLQVQFAQISASLSAMGINWSDVWNALLTATGIVAAGIGALILGVIGVVAGLATGLASGISATITMFQSLADNIQGIFTGLTTIFAGWVVTISALLSGDFALAWEGFKTVLQGAFTFWTSMWTGMLDAVVGVIGIISSTVGGFVQGFLGFFQGMYNELIGNSIIPDIVNGIASWFKKIPDLIISALSGMAQKIAKPFEDASKVVKKVLSTLGDLAEETLPLLEEGFDFVTEAIKTAISYFNSLIEAVSNFELPPILQPGSPPPFAVALTDIANSAADAAGGVKALDQSMAGAAAAASHMLQNLAVGGKGNIMDAISEGLGFGAKMFKGNEALGEGERDAAEDSLRAAYAKYFDLIKEGTAGAEQLKAEFLHGIKLTGLFDEEEIKQALGAVNFGGVVEAIRGQIGPLTLELKAQALGLAQQFAGFAMGFADMLKSQIADFQRTKEEAAKLASSNTKLTTTMEEQEAQLNALKQELTGLTTAEGADTVAIQKKQLAVEKATESLSFQERQLAILRQELAQLTSQEEVDTIAVEKKKLAIDKLLEGMDSQQKQLVILKEELKELTKTSELDTAAVQEKQLAIDKLSQELDKNKTAIQENEKALADYHKELQRKVFTGLDSTGQAEVEGEMAMIELLNKFLAGKEEQLKIDKELEGFATGTTYSLIFDRVEAQEELNRLLAEQQKREEEIARAQEAQRQLAFLQQQIGLMKLAAEQGFDLGTLLPQGIKFGLEASTQDLLAATNAVVEAMVNQLNKDLEIHSPSGVMVDIFGQVMAGAARGVEMGQGLLAKAMAQIPVLNGSIPQPTFSQQSRVPSTNSSTYNFPMTVHTAATAPAVIRQYEIKRSMYAN